jgi:DNA-binding NtrC family response regulator
MSLNPSLPPEASTAPQTFRPDILTEQVGSALARPLDQGFRTATRSNRRLVLALAHGLEPGDDCHCDFNSLLVEMLALFANCSADRLERELLAAFRRVCEFLELKGGGLWLCSGPDTKSFALQCCYPASANGSSSGQFQTGLSASFPWLVAQAQRGEITAFSNLGQLPAHAACDRDTLLRLGALSGAMIPFRVDCEVAGMALFVINGTGPGWSQGFLDRLRFVAHVLAAALARKVRDDRLHAALIQAEASATKRKVVEEALAESNGEIKQLRERVHAQSALLKPQVKLNQDHPQIIGRSPGIKRVLHQVEQVAAAECAVLISGETGTGKELIAQEIHRLSRRAKRPMMLVNCAALPATLVESELFGRERGAYTGALTAQAGRFEMANGSTIFLDEVGELPLEVQAKLLRVLQQGEFQRLGSPQTHKVDVRVIAASNRDLSEDVRKGRFREDLYYRLRVFPIHIPPLRERLEDIPLLAFSFMDKSATQMGRKFDEIRDSAVEKLQQYGWPGNIRELRNVIEYSAIVSTGDTLQISWPGRSNLRQSKPVTLADAEREHILTTLESTGWRIKGPHGAAQRLDVQPSTLYSRMQKLGILNRRRKDEMAT